MEITDGWWTWFDNEDLNRTLQIALERNYDIAAAAARLLFISCRTKYVLAFY
jgi:outer membrane protein TolC